MSNTLPRSSPASATPTIRLYLRRSTDGAKQGASLETQESVCGACAERRGLTAAWSTRVRYCEADNTGRDDMAAHVEWHRLIRDVVPGDIVVTYARDRVGADLEWALALRDVGTRGARLIVASTDEEPRMVGGVSDLVEVLHGLTAKEELTKLRRRTKDALAARRADGHAYTAPPYGYVTAAVDGGRKQLVICEAEAVTVRRIFALFLEGVGLRRIGRMLTDEGVPTPGGGSTWHPSVTRRILRTPAYAGSYGGRPRPDLVIIDPAMADEVTQRLAKRATDAAATHTADCARHLLTGVLRCGACRNSMEMKVRPGKMHYVCSRYRRGGCAVRRHWARVATETAVLKFIRGPFFVDAEGMIRDEIRAEVERLRTLGTADAEGLRAALATAKARKARAMKMALDTDDEDAHKAHGAAVDEVRRLERALADAARPAIDDVTAVRIERAALAGLAHVRDRLIADDLDLVRRTLRTLFPDGIFVSADGEAQGTGGVPGVSSPSGEGTAGTQPVPLAVRFRIAP